MTINKIHIAAFGGLKDYTLELNNGLNVILGENENGKSTVMAFIKMMFYGSGRKSNDLNKNPRMKFTPWSGDVMGGRIYFEHERRRYCLEREFKSSDSTDRTTLRDLDLGTNVAIAPADLGKHFFSLSEAAFERSAFISGNGVFSSNSEAGGELNAKLSNTVTTGDADTSYQVIKQRIKTALGELVTAKHVGKYDKGVARLKELKDAYEKADAAAKSRDELNQKIEVLKKQLTDTKVKYDKVKAVIDSENDIRNTEKLQEYLETKNQLDQLNNSLKLSDGKYADSLFIGKVNFCLSKFDNECRKFDEKQTELAELETNIRIAEENQSKANPELLEELKLKVENLSKDKENTYNIYEEKSQNLLQAQNNYTLSLKKRRVFNPILLIMGMVLLIGAVVTFIAEISAPVSIALAAIGVVFSALSFVIRPLDKAAALKNMQLVSELQQELSELKNQAADTQSLINDLNSEINAVTIALNTSKAMLEKQKEELENHIEELENSRQQKQNAWLELCDIFSRFTSCDNTEQIRSQLEVLTERTEEQKTLKLRLKYLSSDLNNISYEEAAEKLAKSNSAEPSEMVDFDAARAQLAELNELGVKLSSELSAAITELKSELKHAVDPQSLMHEINELSFKLEEQKEFIDSINVASEVLEESYAELRSGYGSALEKRTLEIFSQLTMGRYSNLNISESLIMETEPSGIFGTRSIEYLSSGTIDQAYLSLRLALCELITDGEKLPLILDDALSQYDDTRAAAALKFLKDYSQNTQALLFTCHNSIYETANQLGIETRLFNQ